MHPVLFQIGPLRLYSYGLMMGIAFIVAISWSIHRAPRYRIAEEFISNLSFVIVVSGVLGGRLGHFLFERPLSDLFSFQFFEFWNGGMVFYGGLLGAILGIWVYCRK